MSLDLSSNLNLNLRLQHGHGERSSSFSVNLSSFPAFPNSYSKSKAGISQLNGIKAMATDDRENLAHLHRSRTSKKRTAPVSPPVGLWDRFPTARTVQQMMETMERMTEDPFSFSNGIGWSPSLISSEVDGYRRGRTPWEMKEAEGEYKMRFDMPGMTKEDAKVWVEEKMLVVKAQKMSETKKKSVLEEGAEVEMEEEDESAKSYGRYYIRVALPENAKFEQMKAEVKDGVLYITIPKASNSSKVFEIHVE